MFLLSTNDKTIKLWKIFEKKVVERANYNFIRYSAELFSINNVELILFIALLTLLRIICFFGSVIPILKIFTPTNPTLSTMDVKWKFPPFLKPEKQVGHNRLWAINPIYIFTNLIENFHKLFHKYLWNYLWNIIYEINMFSGKCRIILNK